MPPLPPIANGRQLTVKYDLYGQPAVSVLGFYATEPDEALTVAEGMRVLNAWWGSLRGNLSTSVSCTGGILRDVSVVGGSVIELGAPTSNVGARAQQLSLAAACFVAKWGTAVGTRSGKGRTFIPGVAEDQVQGTGRALEDTTRTAVLTGIQNSYLGVLTPTAGNLVPAVISRKDLIARQVTSVQLAPIVGIQRNRMR